MGDYNLTYVLNHLTNLLIEKGPGIIMSLLTLIIGWWIINVITKVFKRALTKSKSDISNISIFLSKFINVTLKIMLLVSVASMIGIETTSFIAVIGAAGLAVGMALQGSLANFAGGILIILFRPYKVGDFIEGTGGTGTVARIDLLHTVLVTPDNKEITIPNAQLSNNSIVNYSMNDTRRLDFNIGISYGTDIKKARKIAIDTLAEDSRILTDPAPIAVITSLDDSSINLSTRVWVKPSDYWDVFFEYLEKIKEAFGANDIEIPFPQTDVNLKNKNQKI